jgi:hypothetical protein
MRFLWYGKFAEISRKFRVGPKIKLKEHIKACVYEKFKVYIMKNDETIDQLKSLVRVSMGFEHSR